MSNRPLRQQVLVLEDEPLIGRICKRALEKDGFDVEIALDGELAIEMVEKKEYDIFLCDIRTPKISGMDFYRYLKNKNPDLADRVIFTTGDMLSTDVKEFLDNFKGKYISKPFVLDELKEMVSKTAARYTS